MINDQNHHHRVWEKAWQLEDVYWCIRTRCHQSLTLLNNVCSSSRYIIWWQLSDLRYDQMYNCEVMVKLLCRASLLKVDDVRLKSSPAAAKFCTLCDLGAYDDANHMILQCPFSQHMRNAMFRELRSVSDGQGGEVLDSGNDLFLTLMGKIPADIPTNIMLDFWLVSAKYIADMYRNKIKRGIG